MKILNLYVADQNNAVMTSLMNQDIKQKVPSCTVTLGPQISEISFRSFI